MSRPDTTPTAPLLQQQWRVLTTAVPQAALGDGAAVHKARVASRRLREILPVAVGRRPYGALNRRVRRLTQALGPVREVDVTLALLASSVADGRVSRRAAVPLKQALVQRRADARQRMKRLLERLDLADLEAQTMAAARRRPRIAQARARLVKRAAHLEFAMVTAAGLYIPEQLHEVRIAVKKLRYAEEVLTAVSSGAAGQRLRTLKRAQDILGRMHDLDVIVGAVRQLQGAEQPPSLGICAELDGFVRELDAECRRLHGQYMSLRERLLRICADTGERARKAA
jgi:CHAD domain-containing protein